MRTVLWWGRFDPEYSRNRILKQALEHLGFCSILFHPRISAVGDLEASLKRTETPDLVWVPCFRQRDTASARRWCDRKNVPLLFDPLISSYDKQVLERCKLNVNGWRAKSLRRWEGRLFNVADILLADTFEHLEFFRTELGVSSDRLHVVPVGAEESLFFPAPIERQQNSPLELLFYGSFLHLQGPEVIVEAARRYSGPPVKWRLLGDGPLRPACEKAASGLNSLQFENWLPYTQLPDRIRKADILLGVFGDTPKAARVIPNKVFQSLACGKPLVTRSAPAYPKSILDSGASGIRWVLPNDPDSLAQAITKLAANPDSLFAMSSGARKTYEAYFSQRLVEECLGKVLFKIKPA